MKALLRFLLLAAAALALAALAVSGLRVGPPPVVDLVTEARAIGPRAPVRARASAAGRGLAGLRLEIEQKGRVMVLERRDHVPPPSWSFWGARTLEDELAADVGHKTLPGLAEGEAIVRVVAERAW